MLTHKETSPVRLLHIVGESRFGGAARIILRLGQIAQAEGWQVDVLTTDPVFQHAVKQHGLGLVNLDVIRREIRPVWDLGGLVRLHQVPAEANLTRSCTRTHPKRDSWDGSPRGSRACR